MSLLVFLITYCHFWT